MPSLFDFLKFSTTSLDILLPYKMQRKIKYPPNLYTIKNPTNLYKIKYWRLVRLELYFRPKLIQIQIYLLSPNDQHRLHLPQLMSAICGQHYK